MSVYVGLREKLEKVASPSRHEPPPKSVNFISRESAQ
jgi:hypothetical protein